MSPAAENEPPVPAPLPRWFLAGAVALPIVLSFFSRYQQRAFDSYVHMFFADHYLQGWFELWEPRWYGGFSVITYPPLAHQLVAVFASIFGHEPGFVVTMGLAMAALPFAAAAFARAIGSSAAVPWVFLLLALWPTSHRFAYVYGQLPMMVATPLALFGMATLKKYLTHGGARRLALFGLLIGATAAAHHVTTIFAALGCGMVGLGHVFFSAEKAPWRTTLLRAAPAVVVAAVAIGFTILPFWQFARQEPQTEIPHVSRDPLWARPFGLDVVEQLVFVVVGLGGLVASALKRRSLLMLAAGVVFFAVLSMGTTTELPRLLFRSQYRWLTYDKFHNWAAIWFCVLVAQALPGLKRSPAVLLCLGLGPLALFEVSHKNSDGLQPEFITDLRPLLATLTEPDAAHYRHLTLGFGDQFCRLSFLGRSPNVDGDYHTARNDPVLRQSGVATLDASKYYPEGPRVLQSVLSRASALSLKWVFVNDPWYYEYLMSAGYQIKDVWQNGVTLFENPDVLPLPPDPVDRRTGWGLFWGLVPLSVLALALVLAAFELRAPQPRTL